VRVFRRVFVEDFRQVARVFGPVVVAAGVGRDLFEQLEVRFGAERHRREADLVLFSPGKSSA
jgi:hypothetical protein